MTLSSNFVRSANKTHSKINSAVQKHILKITQHMDLVCYHILEESRAKYPRVCPQKAIFRCILSGFHHVAAWKRKLAPTPIDNPISLDNVVGE